MKRTILMLALFLVSVFLSWCTNTKQIDQLKQQNALLKEQINQQSDDFFKKTEQCLAHKNEIEKDLLEKQQKSERKYSLEQIFYSPKTQRCYFVSITEEWNRIGRWLYEYWNHSYYSQSVYACDYYYEDLIKKDNWCAELDVKVKELKLE